MSDRRSSADAGAANAGPDRAVGGIHERAGELLRLQSLCQQLLRQLNAMAGASGPAADAAPSPGETAPPSSSPRSAWIERQMAEKVATISDLRSQIALNRQRQELHVAAYLDELEALRSRVAELSAKLDMAVHSRSVRARHHRRFAGYTSHALIEGFSTRPSSPELTRELIMNAPLFTRNNYQPLFQARSTGEYQLTEFLALHDRNFVRAAYLAILHREPDPQGAAHYLGEVRAGESKGLILHQMSQSQEAKQFRTVIHGLKSHVRLVRWCQRPFIGRPLEGMLFFFNVGAHLRDLRALENHVIRIAEEAQLLHEANMTKLRSLTN